MATDSKAVLKDLIEACRDGQNGYRDAAEQVTDSSLKSFFNEQSLERAKFAGELEQELERLGEPRPDKSGSIAGAVHRKWIEVKVGLGGGDHAILSSVEQGEDSAKDTYEKAINTSGLPESVLTIIRRQFSSVKAAHDRVKTLRDSSKAA